VTANKVKDSLAHWKGAAVLLQDGIEEPLRVVISVSRIPKLVREEVGLIILFLLRIDDGLPVCSDWSGLCIREELLR